MVSADPPRPFVHRLQARPSLTAEAVTLARTAPNALSLIGEPVTFGVHPEDYEQLLVRHGFRVLHLLMASELQARYGVGSAAVDDSLYVLVAERSS